jgi:NAD(P)-dependent dehydrogenase (short-subunit alcohol dehydrogenase family)
MDVTVELSVTNAAAVAGQSLDAVDLLINAAGVEDTAGSSGPIGTLELAAMLRIYQTNAIGPALVTQAFTHLLAESGTAVVLMLTSKLGSMSSVTEPGSIGYSMSKASLNTLTRKLALDLLADRIAVVAMSPGWVRTDMGGPGAPLSPADSVATVLARVDRLSFADNGSILTSDRLPPRMN